MLNGRLTLYDVLGVKESATPDEIRAGFRKNAARFHPDVNKDPQAVEALKIVTNAYEVLSDVGHRSQYDAKLAAMRAPTPQPMVVQIMGQGFGGFSGFGTTNSTATTMGGGGSTWFQVF
jgi:DnaJ-class molecular chaperone